MGCLFAQEKPRNGVQVAGTCFLASTTHDDPLTKHSVRTLLYSTFTHDEEAEIP